MGHLEQCNKKCKFNISQICSYGGWNSHGKCFLKWEKEQEQKSANLKTKKVKRNKDKYDFQEIYDRWWLGKKCELSTGEIKEISEIKLIGPPSFVYGTVMLHFTDGEKRHVNQRGSYRPKKSDVLIVE